MNQHRSRQLRAIFRQIAPFSPLDPRNRTAWQGFKVAYLKQPWNQRAKYLGALQAKVAQLLPAEPVEATS